MLNAHFSENESFQSSLSKVRFALACSKMDATGNLDPFQPGFSYIMVMKPHQSEGKIATWILL